MTNVEPRSRIILSSLGFWVVIAYFVLAFVVVWLYVVNGRQTHEVALRAASIKSAATAQVAQCFNAERTFPLTKGFIEGQKAIIDNSLIANRDALEQQPTSSLTPLRRRSVERLLDARKVVVRLEGLIVHGKQTKMKCEALANKLQIEPSQFEKG